MEKHIIRWQQKHYGHDYYSWRYLSWYEIHQATEIWYDDTIDPDAAIQIPKTDAEWLCDLLDTQEDLNPVMIRVEG